MLQVLQNAFVQKLIWTVLAVGVYVLSALPLLGRSADKLDFFAGVIIGGVWVIRPGDREVLKAGKQSIRESMAPVALVVGVMIVSVFLGACAGSNAMQRADDYAKRLNAAKSGLLEVSPIVDAGCGYLNDRPPCASVRQALKTAQASEALARKAIAAYAASGEGWLTLLGNVIAAEADAAALALEVNKLKEAIRAEAHRIESGGSPDLDPAEASGLDAGTADAEAPPMAPAPPVAP